MTSILLMLAAGIVDKSVIVVGTPSIRTRMFLFPRIEISSFCIDTEEEALSISRALPFEEAIFAGGELNKKNGTYYLVDNISSDNFWTISHAYFGGYAGRAFAVASHGIANVNTDNPNTGMRPTVSLIPGTLILSGNGTKTTPYVIN